MCIFSEDKFHAINKDAGETTATSSAWLNRTLKITYLVIIFLEHRDTHFPMWVLIRVGGKAVEGRPVISSSIVTKSFVEMRWVGERERERRLPFSLPLPLDYFHSCNPNTRSVHYNVLKYHKKKLPSATNQEFHFLFRDVSN